MSAAPRRQGPLVRLAASRAGSFWFINLANRIDRWLVPATNGRLSSAPGQNICVVETIGARVWANAGRSGDYHARVASGEERERLWRVAAERYPGYDTYAVRAGGREIPVVALTPTGA